MSGRRSTRKDRQETAASGRVSLPTLRPAPLASPAARSAMQPVLVVMSGYHIGLHKRVTGHVLVGRDPSADLVLSDPGVAWHHARLEPRGPGWFLVDLGSACGTFLSGSRITECAVCPNDRIVLGDVVVGFDVHDAVEQAYDARVQQLLDIDELTGLFVRRKFEAELRIMVEAAQQQGGRLGVLAMDLDGVKAVNDAHGHRFGEELIRDAGRLIGLAVREPGIAARLGGDEFVAALPGADTNEAEAIADEIRRKIASHLFEHDGISLHTGISIGVAWFPSSAADSAGLLRRADEALYRAKRAGRNRVSR